MALASICRLSIDSTFSRFSHLGATARRSHPTFVSFSRNFAEAVKKMGLPRVFFDMSADNMAVGRIVMEVNNIYIYNLIFFICEWNDASPVSNHLTPLWPSYIFFIFLLSIFCNYFIIISEIVDCVDILSVHD